MSKTTRTIIEKKDILLSKSTGIHHVTYSINKQSKVVQCSITLGVQVDKLFDCEFYETMLDGVIDFYSLNKGRTFTGKARCTGTDVFDEKVGKRIAFDKAMIKLNNAMVKSIHRDIKALEKSINYNTKKIEEIEKSTKKRREYIESTY